MLMDQYDYEGDSIMRILNHEIIDIDEDVIEIKMEPKNHEIIEIIDEPAEELPYKKSYIPLVVKRRVWDKWVGRSIGTCLCLCCKLTEISQMSFHCGHVIAERNGGQINVDNLRPICQSCNSSMRTQNMDEFMKKYKL
jgi:hypothetical protein